MLGRIVRRRGVVVVGTVHGNRAIPILIPIRLASSLFLTQVIPHPSFTKRVLRFKPRIIGYVEHGRRRDVGCVGWPTAAAATQNWQVQGEENNLQKCKPTMNPTTKTYSILRTVFSPTM